MKGQNQSTVFIAALFVIGAGLFVTSGFTDGSQLNSLHADSDNPNETVVEQYIPFLSSIEKCDFGEYNRCIEDSYTANGVTATSLLAYQNYLDSPTTEDSLNYDCNIGDKAALVSQEVNDINNVVTDWKNLETTGEEVSLEGEIPLTDLKDGFGLICMSYVEESGYWTANGVYLSDDGFTLEEPTESPTIKTYKETEITPTEDGMKATVYLENVGGDMQERNLVELQPREQQLFSFVGEQSTCDSDNPQNVNKEFQLNQGEKVSFTLESSGLEPGEYDAVMVSTDGCASEDPSVVSTEPFGWQTTVESDVVVEKDEPSVVEYREPSVSTGFNEVSATVYLENTGGDMTEDYLVELQPRRSGSLSFLNALSFVGDQETCDSSRPENVHKDFSLKSGERTSFTLRSTGLDEGSYDVVLVSTDGCASKDPSVVSVAPYNWYENVESVDVESPNTAPVIDSVTVPSTAEVGQEFPVSVQASDVDDDDLTVEWGNGDTGTSTSYSFDSLGVKEISVSVSDGTETVSATSIVEVVEPEPEGFFEKIVTWFQNLF